MSALAELKRRRPDLHADLVRFSDEIHEPVAEFALAFLDLAARDRRQAADLRRLFLEILEDPEQLAERLAVCQAWLHGAHVGGGAA